MTKIGFSSEMNYEIGHGKLMDPKSNSYRYGP